MLLRELERADGAVARELAELDELARETEEMGARARELEEFLARLPAEREGLRRAREEAGRQLNRARQELAEAERLLAAAEGDRRSDRAAEARRRIRRARDELRLVERRGGELREREARLEHRAEEAEGDARRLQARALELAGVLRGRPRLAERAGVTPAPGVAGVAEWASGARAALFVARAGLGAEREAVIRQANELGALVLGEPLGASSAATVVHRVERAIESDR